MTIVINKNELNEYYAIYSDVYDGAIDGNNMMGRGNSVAEAIIDLAEQLLPIVNYRTLEHLLNYNSDMNLFRKVYLNWYIELLEKKGYSEEERYWLTFCKDVCNYKLMGNNEQRIK